MQFWKKATGHWRHKTNRSGETRAAAPAKPLLAYVRKPGEKSWSGFYRAIDKAG